MRICIVDDNAFVRDSLAFLLRDAGHDVLLAEDASAALELAENTALDVVVADYEMPGMKGDALALALRARRPDLKVVLSSGRPLPPGAAAGASEFFLPKPFTLRVLLDILERAQAQSQAPV